MADMVVFYEDEDGMFFLSSGESFTNDFSQALCFVESRAEQMVKRLRESYPQRVFEMAVMP